MAPLQGTLVICQKMCQDIDKTLVEMMFGMSTVYVRSIFEGVVLLVTSILKMMAPLQAKMMAPLQEGLVIFHKVWKNFF